MQGSPDTTSRTRRSRLRARAGNGARMLTVRFPWALAVGLAAFAVATFASMFGRATPEAQAVPVVDDVLDTVGGLFGDVAGGIATKSFQEILEFLFGGFQAELTVSLVKYLTRFDATLLQGNVAELGSYVQALAFGAAAAVATIAVVRYYISGLSMSGAGGLEGIEGFTRLVGAILFITAWPWMVPALIDVVNALTKAIVDGGETPRHLRQLFSAVTLAQISGNPLGLFAGIITMIAAILGFFALLFMKVVINALLVFVFVAAPLAIIIWPIPELSWVARKLLSGLMTALLAPVIWALVFATFAAVGPNVAQAPGSLGKITTPLVGLGLLYLAVTLPRSLARGALMGAQAPGGGFAGRMASYTAGQMVVGGLRDAGLAPGGRRDGAVMQTMRGSGGSGISIKEPFNSASPVSAQGAQMRVNDKAHGLAAQGVPAEDQYRAEQQAARDAERDAAREAATSTGAPAGEVRADGRDPGASAARPAEQTQRAVTGPHTPTSREAQLAAHGFNTASNNPGLQLHPAAGGNGADARFARAAVDSAVRGLMDQGLMQPPIDQVADAVGNFAPATQQQLHGYARQLQDEVHGGSKNQAQANAEWQETMTQQMSRPGIGDSASHGGPIRSSFQTLATSTPNDVLSVTGFTVDPDLNGQVEFHPGESFTISPEAAEDQPSKWDNYRDLKFIEKPADSVAPLQGEQPRSQAKSSDGSNGQGPL